MVGFRPVETALLIGILSVTLRIFGLHWQISYLKMVIPFVDLVFIGVGLSAIVLWPKKALLLVKRNPIYFILATSFVAAAAISASLADLRLISLRDVLQMAAYLWILPFILLYRPNLRIVYTTAGKILVTIGVVSLIPYFLVFGWTRFNPFNLHPNPTGYLFGLFAIVLSHYGSILFSIMAIIVVGFTFSRSAMGSLAVVLTLKGYMERKVLRYVPLALLSVSLLFVAPPILKGLVALRSHFKSEYVKMAESMKPDYKPAIGVVRGKGYEVLRVLMWEASIEMWRKRPLTGIGFGQYPYRLVKECKNHKIPQKYCTKWVKNVDAHNIFLQTLSEVGVLGFITFWSLIIFLFLRIRKNPLSLYILLYILLFSLLQPSPLFTGDLAPISWLLILWGGGVDWGTEGDLS
ncbi:MAG: O-antigen ligase family protein [Thermotogae bacterium]|nr:O-antigen ligase family protein [Thermotogota bacterium]